MDYETDFAIIGSGFGGAVCALRLSEKGYRVTVLEQGRRINKEDMLAAVSPRHLFWLPALGLKGFFTQNIFRHVGIVGGVGVGGGSLVYAAALLEPGKNFFSDPAWPDLGIDWQSELKPHYQTASRMFGVNPNPYFDDMDEWLRQTAETMGVASSYGSVDLGVYFGEPDVTVADPYFNGKGPIRTGCIKCGACLTGCPYDSKNSLDCNYLYLAEKCGAQILPEHQVTAIHPLPEGGYSLQTVNPIQKGQKYPPLRTRRVVIAAGVLGTLHLLFRCRDEIKTLPGISEQLGATVRTNSEAITGILLDNKEVEITKGTTISSDFYPDPNTHITQNRFPPGYEFMKLYMGPLVDDPRPFHRAFKTIAAYLLHPLRSTMSWRIRNWYRRISILTVMQNLDNQVSMTFGRSIFNFFRKGLCSQSKGKSAPSFLPIANQAARIFARHAGGIPHNNIPESVFNLSVTAHILGGCQIGKDRMSGVIDSRHEVFGYPGLYVVDASSIPANLGVNPALTITALAERAMSLIPRNNDNELTESGRASGEKTLP